MRKDKRGEEAVLAQRLVLGSWKDYTSTERRLCKFELGRIYRGEDFQREPRNAGVGGEEPRDVFQKAGSQPSYIYT